MYREGDNDGAGAEAQDRIIADYMAKTPPLEEDTRDLSTRVFVSWPFLRIERHFGRHFDEQETAIELRLPWKVAYKLINGWKLRVPRSYVLVFGRVHTRLIKHAWHMRGALSTWDSPWL